MRILILGYSDIARRRIIPAIKQIKDFIHVDVASASLSNEILLPKEKKGSIFNNYEEALSKSSADIVYISTTPSTHAQLAKEALLQGFHVIVDKPAFSSLQEAEDIIKLANKGQRCLAEALSYAYHPQIKSIKDVFSLVNSEPIRITSIFSFPPLKADNFRYIKALGGGALIDLAPYAVTPGRLFFRDDPEKIYCQINNRAGKDNVEVSFSMLAKYSKGRTLIGHFGFDTEYRNYMNILGQGVSVEINRIFSIPPEMQNELQIRESNKIKIQKVPTADCFAIFLEKILESIKKENYKELTDDILSDASVSHKLRLAVL